jgi:haloalkane dehalogenase
MPDVSVLDSTMHYEEVGEGDPIVLLHGNPTSSFLWRKVIPGVAGEGRVLAPDLIGMGRSGKPDIGYRFVEHARYLDAWFDALALERVTLVGHDWGGALGFHWARRHPDRVAAVAFMETIVKPTTWGGFPEAAREMFQGFRTPGTGEQLVLEQNMFVDAVLPASMLHQLTAEEMDAYREPFLEPSHRLPTLTWPRELPIDGEPADVVELVDSYDRWLASSEDVPKLLLTFEPGAIMSEPVIRWCQENIAALEVANAGQGIHFVQEDQPEAIARIVSEWRRGARLTR